MRAVIKNGVGVFHPQGFLDGNASGNSFLSIDDIEVTMNSNADMILVSLQRVITKGYVDTHCDIMSLLRSVKGVGAGETGQRQPPLTRRDLKKLAMAYSNMSSVESKLPLTYRVSHFRLEKR